MARTMSATRAGASAAALTMLVVVAGCTGGGSATSVAPGQNFTEDQSRRFVPEKGDLPRSPGFTDLDGQTRTVPCDSGWLANQGPTTETAGEAAIRQQVVALGAGGCRLSDYEVGAEDDVTSLRVLAVVFPSPEAASSSLGLLRSTWSDPLLIESWGEEGDTPPPASDVPSPGLGDESTPGVVRSSGTGPGSVGLYGVSITQTWRVRNVAVVMTASHATYVDEDDVLQLAKNISARVVT